MRKSTVRKKILLPDFLSSCRTDLFLELVMSGDWQSFQTVLDLRASNFRGLSDLAGHDLFFELVISGD